VSGALAVQNDLFVGAIGAAIGAFVTGIFAWLTQRQKGSTEQSVAVLAEWSKLNEALADRLAAVEKECAQMRKDHAAEIENIRRDHSAEMDALWTKHRRDMRAQRELNEGLQRMIAANSQSAAYLISDSPVSQARDEDDED
jgi:Skp family chaperone for outer membrane proteins